MALLNLSAHVCERVLREHDNVISAIRFIDVFFVHLDPSQLPEKQAVQMMLLVTGSVDIDDDREHAIEITLTRPSGEVTSVGKHTLGMQRIFESPRGFSAVVQLGLIPKEMGTHVIKVFFDEEERALVPVTLLPPPPLEPSDLQNNEPR